jgi:hypothetical protein
MVLKPAGLVAFQTVVQNPYRTEVLTRQKRLGVSTHQRLGVPYETLNLLQMAADSRVTREQATLCNW